MICIWPYVFKQIKWKRVSSSSCVNKDRIVIVLNTLSNYHAKSNFNDLGWDPSFISKYKILNCDYLQAIKLANKIINGYGRLLVRKSGTELKIRIMCESENKKLLLKCINIVKKSIK